MRKFFLINTIIFFTFFSISKADLLKPNKTLKAIDVLKIQLQSLRNNNMPYKDAGIEQAWEFAHPNNKIVTGPLSNFKKMDRIININLFCLYLFLLFFVLKRGEFNF